MNPDSPSDLVNDYCARGVFRATPLVPAKGETAAWQLHWFGGHVMRLALKADQVTLLPVLPPLSARSALYRELRTWLRKQQSADLPPHRRLDPARMALRTQNHRGDIETRLQSGFESPGSLTRHAIQLINALYHEFLNGPGRLEWIIEAFGLDADNPRLA